MLFSSGLVAGYSIIGVITAFILGASGSYMNFYDNHDSMFDRLSGSFSPYLSLILFALLTALLAHLAYKGMGRKKDSKR